MVEEEKRVEKIVDEVAGFARRVNEIKKVSVTFQADYWNTGEMPERMERNSEDRLEVVAPGMRY